MYLVHVIFKTSPSKSIRSGSFCEVNELNTSKAFGHFIRFWLVLYYIIYNFHRNILFENHPPLRHNLLSWSNFCSKFYHIHSHKLLFFFVYRVHYMICYQLHDTLSNHSTELELITKIIIWSPIRNSLSYRLYLIAEE